MNNTEILQPTDITIVRVSDKKIRIKYKLPIYYHSDEKNIFLGYHKIGITLREITSENKLYHFSKYGITQRNANMYECLRPFEKFFNKISSIYDIKKKNLNMNKYPHYEIFEDKYTYFIIPQKLFFSGDGVKEAIRKWKINKLLKPINSSENIDE